MTHQKYFNKMLKGMHKQADLEAELLPVVGESRLQSAVRACVEYEKEHKLKRAETLGYIRSAKAKLLGEVVE